MFTRFGGGAGRGTLRKNKKSTVKKITVKNITKTKFHNNKLK